jgi:hypothetical protein
VFGYIKWRNQKRVIFITLIIKILVEIIKILIEIIKILIERITTVRVLIIRVKNLNPNIGIIIKVREK